MACPRGYRPINDLLQRNGMDLSRCYLSCATEKFSYISILALLSLLVESQDPILICLEGKEAFAQALLKAFQIGVARAIR